MIVSLEAIFLSTFVMISQNRADAKRQVIADQQWQTVQGGGPAERAAARALQADSRPDEGRPRLMPRAQTMPNSPGWTRTNNPPVNSRMLCQLSYRGSVLSGRGL